MRVQVSIPVVAPGVGVVELATDTEQDTVTIRFGDYAATVKRIDLVDATNTRLGPSFPMFEPPDMGGGPVIARGIRR